MNSNWSVISSPSAGWRSKTKVKQYNAVAASCHIAIKTEPQHYNSLIDLVNEIPKFKPEDHWSCIAHLSAEDMLN